MAKKLKEKRFSFYFKSIKENWKSKIPDFLLFILTIIISTNIIGITETNKKNHTIIILIIVFILYVLKIYNESKELLDIQYLKQIETNYENISQTLSSFPTDYLKLMYKEFNFSNAERISLYIYDKDSFKIIGRHSSNPEYNNVNRRKYPIDEGFISKCWVNNNGKSYYFIQNLPSSNLKRYNINVKKKVSISDNTIKNLTMKSRSYYVRMITNDGKFQDANGVIVLETTRETFNISEDEISKFLEKQTTIPLLHRLIEMNSISGGKKDE